MRSAHHGHQRFGDIAGLVTEELIDCQGRTTHRLVLELDGTVRVRFVERDLEVRIDPRTSTVLTPGVQVPPQVMNAAAAMRVM